MKQRTHLSPPPVDAELCVLISFIITSTGIQNLWPEINRDTSTTTTTKLRQSAQHCGWSQGTASVCVFNQVWAISESRCSEAGWASCLSPFGADKGPRLTPYPLQIGPLMGVETVGVHLCLWCDEKWWRGEGMEGSPRVGETVSGKEGTCVVFGVTSSTSHWFSQTCPSAQSLTGRSFLRNTTSW